MDIGEKTPIAIAEELGERLKQARLNRDMTQLEVAERAGVSRKAVLNAEKGIARLEILVAIMAVLDLTRQLDLFLPPQDVSPIQLARLKGKARQRASGRRKVRIEEPIEW
ncbi:MAG: helix-turn-helix transcriptional regulator [Proteobacteria bacterium]|nr:helix-turn-helix transcriptional regulator [Pseudomonadota bacterium]